MKGYSMLRRFVTRGLCVIAAVYLSVAAVLYFKQDALIFQPFNANKGNTPTDFGVPYVPVRISVQGQGEITAWYLAQPQGAATAPTLLYCHGNGGNLPMLAHVSSIFFNYGWNVLLFDYRGYGESSPVPGKLSEKSMEQDAMAAYEWLLATQPSARERIVIWGHSLGSAVAARLAGTVIPAGLILEGAFPSILAVARDRYRYIPLFEFMLSNRFDTAHYLERSTFPKLFLHADQDKVIPISLGREAFDEVPEPKSFIVADGIGHNDFPSVHQKYAEKIREVVRGWVDAKVASVAVRP